MLWIGSGLPEMIIEHHRHVYIFSNVYLTVQREVAVSSQVFDVACNFSRSDVFIKQQTLYKVDYSVSPNIDIQEASTKK